jgi:hypothetical protein
MRAWGAAFSGANLSLHQPLLALHQEGVLPQRVMPQLSMTRAERKAKRRCEQVSTVCTYRTPPRKRVLAAFPGR